MYGMVSIFWRIIHVSLFTFVIYARTTASLVQSLDMCKGERTRPQILLYVLYFNSVIRFQCHRAAEKTFGRRLHRLSPTWDPVQDAIEVVSTTPWRLYFDSLGVDM